MIKHSPLRTTAYAFTILLIVPAIVFGWYFIFMGGTVYFAFSALEALLAASHLVVTPTAFFILWYLNRERKTHASLTLILQGIAWVAVAWNTQSNGFMEWGLGIAAVSILIGSLLLLAPEVPESSEPPR